jgi:hypothetical protein
MFSIAEAEPNSDLHLIHKSRRPAIDNVLAVGHNVC